MKQLLLDLTEENDRRLSIPFNQTVEDELVSFMRQAIIRVFKQGGKSDDTRDISK